MATLAGRRRATTTSALFLACLLGILALTIVASVRSTPQLEVLRSLPSHGDARPVPLPSPPPPAAALFPVEVWAGGYEATRAAVSVQEVRCIGSLVLLLWRRRRRRRRRLSQRLGPAAHQANAGSPTPAPSFLQVRALLTDDEVGQLSALCGRCLYHSLTGGSIVEHGLGHWAFVATGALQCSPVGMGVVLELQFDALLRPPL